LIKKSIRSAKIKQTYVTPYTKTDY